MAKRPDPRKFYRPTMLQRATPGVVRYIEELEAYCDSLESAGFKYVWLLPYLRHTADCSPLLRGGGVNHPVESHCTCGLREALNPQA